MKRDSVFVVTFGAGMLLAFAPRSNAEPAYAESIEWLLATTDRVSIEGVQQQPGGRTLDILIEKDFKCIHKSDDANEDSYPNPLASTAQSL